MDFNPALLQVLGDRKGINRFGDFSAPLDEAWIHVSLKGVDATLTKENVKKLSQSQDGNEVFFRIKRNTQLKKLMNDYCDCQLVDFNAIAFLFDGHRLRAEQTPYELEMEDGDEINASLHQTGGAPI